MTLPEKLSFYKTITESAPALFLCETTRSTNDDAKVFLAAKPESAAVFIAKTQTGGRGRTGKSFFSPVSGLYMTAAIPVTAGFSDLLWVTPAAAVAVCRAIGKISEKPLRIKWVNDIFIGEKKLCGILAEAFVHPDGDFSGLAIGIGMNLRLGDPSEYPDGLSDIICALDGDVTPAEAASLIASELFSAINEGSTKKLLGEYRSLCIVPGRRIFFEKNGEREYARALCVNPDFSLSVRLESDGSEKALTGGGIFFA